MNRKWYKPQEQVKIERASKGHSQCAARGIPAFELPQPNRGREGDIYS